MKNILRPHTGSARNHDMCKVWKTVWTTSLQTFLTAAIVATMAGSLSNHVFADQANPQDQGGHVKGVVSLDGHVPKPRRHNLVLSPDPYYCGRISDGKGWRLTPFLEKRKPNKGLPGLVVFGEGVPSDTSSIPRPQTIQVKDCLYLPYMNAIQQGKPLHFENWDPIPHQIEIYEYSQQGGTLLFRRLLKRNPEIQKSDFLAEDQQCRHQPGPDVSYEVTRSGPLVFRCSFHEYMEGWAFVLTHPYFSVTGPAGEFSISDIPPGTYNLIVWHPLGRQEHVIHINPLQTLTLDLAFHPTVPVTYAEEAPQPNPFGIDLIGDSQIVPSVERQQWED